jgi:photosystem II stability/assembly factor-like uncharacterized protein
MRRLLLFAALAPLLAGCGSHFTLKRIQPAKTIQGHIFAPDWQRLQNQQGIAIAFATPELGFMATRSGELRRTDDGGQTWRKVGRSWGFVYLSFDSPRHGFGLTDHAKVMETDDGGRCWHVRASFASKAGYPDTGLSGLSFIDARIGWAAPFEFGRVYRTTDGGSSWTTVSRICREGIGALSFVDRTSGFLVCGGEPAAGNQDKDVFATSDGGRTWHRRACAGGTGLRPTCRGLPGGGYVTALDFRDRRVGLLVLSRGGIWRTSDGGRHWRATLFTDDEWFIISTAWASQHVVYALVESQGILLRSDDAGRHWRRVFPPGPGAPIVGVSFESPQRGIGGQPRSLLSRGGTEATTDGGRTWRHISSRGAGRLVRTSRNVVWGIGSTEPYAVSADYLLRSTNGGRHWRRMPSPTELTGATLSFPTARVGYLVDHSKRLFRTTDGGRSWHLVARGIMPGALFATPKVGLVGTRSGLLTTSDGGHSWHAVRLVPALEFPTVTVLDARQWWLEGETCVNATTTITGKRRCGAVRHYLLHTADGGRTWTAIRFAKPLGESMTFVTPTVGYATVSAAGIYRTVDGGRTWHFVRAGPSR